MKLKIKGTKEQKIKLYPSITDQLNAIWKIIENIQGPKDAEKVRKQVEVIKSDLHKRK